MEKLRAIIDIETGGFSKTKNGVMEVGLLIFDEHYNILASYQSYIKPYLRPQEEGEEEQLVSYKEDALKVNGLSIELIEEKGLFVEEVLSDLITIFDDYNISQVFAHNSKFDESFLNVLFDRFEGGYRFPSGDLDCTCQLAKKKLNVKSYSLSNLCEYFGIINNNAHSSIGDCEATLKLLKELEDVK